MGREGQSPVTRELRCWSRAGQGRGGAAPLLAGGGSIGGMVAAHSVDSAAWRGGGGAEVDAWIRCGVTTPSGAEEELGYVHGTTGDVAADEVGIHCFQGGRGENVTGEDAIAEAGGETLDLGFEWLKHTDGRAIGDVTIGPGGVLPFRGAGGIEEAGLRE